MKIIKSLFAGAIGIFGINLLLAGVACNKGNPVNNDGNLVFSTMTDIEGNIYKTIKIGNQEWTVENLRTTKYNDGSLVQLITDSIAWEQDTIGAFCYYNNTTNVDFISKYGALYSWYAINKSKLAPVGWHVPSDSEWNILQNYLIANGYNWDETTTGNKIAKSLASKTDWRDTTILGAIGNDLSSNNKSGFMALPGGRRLGHGSSDFCDFGEFGHWWSASESDAWLAHYRYLRYAYVDLKGNLSNYKSCGFSVRLVKN